MFMHTEGRLFPFMGQCINPDMALLIAGSKSDEILPFFPI